jgi:predicted ATPase
VAALQAQPLIVLDNCEHVIDGAAALAQAIAATCPGTRILATSREALGAGDEQLVAVASLDPVGPGAELFTERARAVSATFDRHAFRAEIEEVCRRVDGIPLSSSPASAWGRGGQRSPAAASGSKPSRNRSCIWRRRTPMLEPSITG